MKKFKFLLLFGLCIMFLNCSSSGNNTDESADDNSSKVVNAKVGVDEFKTLMIGKEYQLVDLRTPEELVGGTIPNAIFIDFNGPDFETKILELDKVKPVLLYCRSGNRSGQAAEFLSGKGYPVIYDLKDGYTAWASRFPDK